MPNILKPKRGKRSDALGENIKLERGEIFFEYPDEGVGTGAGSIKLGDGDLLYQELPYFFDKEAYAATVHTHAISEVNGLTSTLNSIGVRIDDIIDGTTHVGLAENSNRLGGTDATEFVTLSGSQALTNKTYNGYTLNIASTKDVDETVLNEDSDNLPTSKAVATFVNLKIGQVIQIRYVIVTELPDEGEVGTIYLMRHDHQSADIYDEYIWVDNSRFERIGNTDIDLSGYATVNHTHNYEDILNLPALPHGDNETIIEEADGTLKGSRIKVLSNDPVNPSIGDMWVLAL